MTEKYGFVYIWKDAKHKRYYIGCHWGTEDDGYICSSTWMKKGYKRRPKDFKRRIIISGITIKSILHEEEHKWLQMIKDEELGKRYYNVRNHHFNHWSTDEQKSILIKKKISSSPLRNKRISESNKGKKHSEKTKEKIRNIRIGSKYSEETNAKKGRPFSEERKKRQGELLKEYHRKNTVSVKTRKKISNNSKRLHSEGKIGMAGKKHSPETIAKMKKTQAGRGAKDYMIKHPCGKQESITNLRKFCKEHNLHDGHMASVAKGNYKQHKGFVCYYK
jgi:hypothetical protein